MASPRTIIREYIQQNKVQSYLFAILFTLFFTGLFAWQKRNEIIQSVVDHRLETYARKGIIIRIENLTLFGSNELSIDSLNISIPNKGLFLNLSKLKTKVNLLAWLNSRPWLEQVSINRISGIKIFERTDKSESIQNPGLETQSSFRNIPIPKDIQINHIGFEFQGSSTATFVELDTLQKSDQEFSSQMTVNDSVCFSLTGNWFENDLYPKKISVRSKSEKNIKLLGGKWSLGKADLFINDFNPKERSLRSTWSISNIKGEHHKIGTSAFRFKTIKGDVFLRDVNNYWVMDSSSFFELGKVRFHLGLGINKQLKKQFWFYFQLPQTSVQHCLNELPTSIFPNIDGLQIQGNWAYRLFAHITGSKADSNLLESQVSTSSDFDVKKWGASNISGLNSSFVHITPKTKEAYQQSVYVDSAHADYTLLSEVSPYLVPTLLSSEDPAFFQHRGFYLSAFREALTENIIQGYFKRGGSTISMQLIKNLFLNHRKTVGRKFEEILLVWLMEKQKTISKERQLEIYLNIIEWGPNIYGIKKASRFYFNKLPQELNPAECIYLVSLIPAPSLAKWSIDDLGFVSDKWTRFEKLQKRMVYKDSITYDFEPYSMRVSPTALLKLK